MRRILVALTMTGALLAATACQPTTTLTATPSTTKPACKAITTVAGKLTPPNALPSVKLEYQNRQGQWEGWFWFRTGAPGEGRTVIEAPVNQKTGAYTLTYVAPNGAAPGGTSPTTIRLRMHAKRYQGPEATSQSWYVTRTPSGCTP